MPGDSVTAKLKLNFPLPVNNGLRFALREGGKTIAAGVITNVLPDEPGEDAEDGKKKKKKWKIWISLKIVLIYFILLNKFIFFSIIL